MNGADRAQVIRPADIDRLNNGSDFSIGWIAVYIGGPRSAGDGWNLAAIGDLVTAGFGNFLPLYVGRNRDPDGTNAWDSPEHFTLEAGRIDGSDACQLTGQFGFDETTPLCLDVESNTFDWDPEAVLNYVSGWCSLVREAGHKAGIYGPARMIEAARERGLIDFGWAAFWTWTGDAWNRLSKAFPELDTMTSQGLTSPPEIWQFVGDVPVIGGVDLSVARDDFNFARCTIPSSQPVESAESSPTAQPENVQDASPVDAGVDPATYVAPPIETPIIGEYTLEDRVAFLEQEIAALWNHVGRPVAPIVPPIAGVGEYLVRPGDSLTEISVVLGHPGEWHALASANPSLSDPSMIHPGLILKLPEGW